MCAAAAIERKQARASCRLNLKWFVVLREWKKRQDVKRHSILSRKENLSFLNDDIIFALSLSRSPFPLTLK
jgi:hypothetical protein